jgi:hypothetical protein
MNKVIKSVIITFSLICLAACGNSDSKRLYSSAKFSICSDRAEQGDYRSVAVTEDKLVSDYQSPANAFFNPQISFKYSINGRDNEAPSGQDHQALLFVPDTGMIVIRSIFGAKDTISGPVTGREAGIPPNTPVRFEVDMRNVMEAFEKEGSFTDFNGVRIFKSDFKGVWIAGGTVPLSWDFENLPLRDDLRLVDPDGDGIYSCDLVFNVYDESKHTSSEKSVTADLSEYPSFNAPYKLMNALYRMSLQEMMLDIRPDSTFMAGKEWRGVWTRDISYSIVLALAAIEPEISRNSLMYKVKNGKIIQDTGSGGSWPVSTDRQVWALAAWEVYKSTGDTQWLKQAYDIIRSSVEDDLKVAFNPQTGLFYGESSFLDWRKQTYPLWMEPIDIFRSHNLGTNVIFFRTLSILSGMGEVLGIENDYMKIASELRDSINAALWSDDMGYYGQYLYGHYNYSLSPRSESLGESLSALYDVASEEQKKKLFSSVPVMDYGITCIYPQIPGIPPYHNNAIWPFVQAYWTWAGARSGNTAIVEHGIASIYRQAALFLTNKENMVAESGDFNGTEVNSDNQLWSVAANLSVALRIILGLDYESDRLVFRPFIPVNYKGSYVLNGLRYRQATLDITVEGFGDGIASFELDGVKATDNYISASLTGCHDIRIIMNRKKGDDAMNLAVSRFTPATPEPVIASGEIVWKPVPGAETYEVFRNGRHIYLTSDTAYHPDEIAAGEYQVQAIDAGGYASFLSKPLQYKVFENSITVEAEAFAGAQSMTLFGYSGAGFVEIRKESPDFVFNINAPADGDYVIEFRYSNGSGPVNTDNKCAQRSLFCNGVYKGSAIFPQRGLDEWSNWGLSNPLTVPLKKGPNSMALRLEDYNNNMNVSENTFILDFIRCFRSSAVK